MINVAPRICALVARFVLVAVLALALTAGESPAAGPGAIHGRVLDAETRQPLAGANIAVAGTQRGAIADKMGEFTIPGLEPGTYNLTISFVSYEPAVVTDVVVKPGVPTTVLRDLVPVPVAGETIDVRPSFFARNATPTSSVNLSREEIRRFPGGFEDIVRTISTLPGVALVNQGGRNDLLVRGGGPSENLYLVNGLEVPNINHFGNQGSAGGALSFVNLDFVDGVDFSTGGFGSTFGDKMSSVLSIEMREARSDRVGGKATISATQFGLNLEGPLPGENDGHFLFSARKSYLDLLFRALDQPFIPVYTDFNLAGDYRINERYEFSVLGLGALDDVDRDNSTSEDKVVNAGIMGNAQDRWIGGVRLRRLFDWGFLDVIGGYNQVDYSLAQADTNQVEYFSSDALERETALRAEGTRRLPAGFDLSAGAGVKRVGVDYATAFADSIYDRSGRRVAREDLDLPAEIMGDSGAYKLAAWVEARRRVARVEWSGGFRLDYFENLDDTLYPAGRFSFRYGLGDRLTLKGSYGTYYQAPSYVWLGNPENRDLKALRNDMPIAGIDYRVRPDLNLSAEGFYKRYSDLPAGATPDTDYLVLTNTGVGFGGRDDDFQSFGYIPLDPTGKGEAYGVDLLAQKKFAAVPCYGTVGLTLSRTRYTAPNGKTYPGQFDQAAVFTVSGGYVINPRWEVSSKWRFASGAPYTPVYDPATNGGVISNLPDEYLSARLGATHSLDVRVDRRFSFTSWSLIAFLDIQNIYDYEAPVTPTWDFWNQEVVDEQDLGIFPTIGVSAEF
jgi:hypothetical protein